MHYFEQATLRLKMQLQVTEDKQVAEALGMTGNAWTMRKRRNSFPEKELRALAQRRPELDIDVEWVLSGERLQSAQVAQGSVMRPFEAAELRLKLQLQVTEDKQVAEALGMTGGAWTKRKTRNAFPVKELRALAQRRPELGIDVDWVLTGAPGNAIGVVCGGDVRQVEVGCVGAAPVSPAARLRQTASELAAQADAVLVAMDVQPQRPGDRAHVLAAYYLCRGALEVLRAAVQQGDGCGSGVAAADYFTPGVMALARHYRVG